MARREFVQEESRVARMAAPERFVLERSARWFNLAAPWITAILAILCAALPVLSEDGKLHDGASLLGFAVAGFLGFGWATWYFLKIVRNLPEADMSVDDDGLWPTVRDKQIALVPWEAVVRLREREALQRLELLDSAGRVVARLEYELLDFQRLRSIVLQRASLEQAAGSTSGVYRKSVWHHLFSMGSMLGFALLGWYAGQAQPLIGYGGVGFILAVIAWEYATTPFRVRVTPSALEIDWPCRRQRIVKGAFFASSSRTSESTTLGAFR